MNNILMVSIPVVGAVIIAVQALKTTKNRKDKKDEIPDIEKLIKDEIKKQLINLMK